MKPVAAMTSPKSKPWELKLSPVHLVIVLGLITGSMAGAFYLGFSSGQHVGYESALHATLSNMARLPIPAEESDAAATSDDVTSDVYAKLTAPVEREEIPAAKNGSAEDMPELGAIPSTDAVPILPDAVTKGSGAAGTETVGSLVSRSATSSVAAVTHKEPEVVKEAKVIVAESKSSAAAVPEKREEKLVVKEAAIVKEPVKEPVKEVSSPVAAQGKTDQVKTGIAGTIPVRAVIPSGWYVQVAAPRKIEEANEIASALKKAKIPVMIEAAQVRGEEYFRVVAGPQAQRAGAEKVIAQIKAKSVVKGDPFVRAVK